MATAIFGQTCRAPSSSKIRPVARTTACKAASNPDSGAQRRRTLLIGATLPVVSLAAAQRSEALEKFDLPVSQLSNFDRAEQRAELISRAGMELKKVVGAEDARKALRLALNDAGTYDFATKTGGMDGSVILNKSEASRPENAGLSDYVSKLGKAKEAIDAGNAELGSGPMSWADMMALGVKVTQEADWKRIKIARAAIPSGGETIVKTFGADWLLRVGRIDATSEPANRALAPGAPTDKMEQFYLQLGAKPGGDSGPFSPKPPFWQKYSFILYSAAQDDPEAYEQMLADESKEFANWKLTYDRSRATVTRTNYEVDFITAFDKLSSLGAKFDPDAYMHPRVTYRYG